MTRPKSRTALGPPPAPAAPERPDAVLHRRAPRAARTPDETIRRGR